MILKYITMFDLYGWYSSSLEIKGLPHSSIVFELENEEKSRRHKRHKIPLPAVTKGPGMLFGLKRVAAINDPLILWMPRLVFNNLIFPLSF